jgi:hypothetical protein
MISDRIGYEPAIVVVFCILSLFLFPSVQGSYSATHGPVTALQAMRAAAHVRLAILTAALRVFSVFRVSSLEGLSSTELFGSEFLSAPPSESSTILRC